MSTLGLCSTLEPLDQHLLVNSIPMWYVSINSPMWFVYILKLGEYYRICFFFCCLFVLCDGILVGNSHTGFEFSLQPMLALNLQSPLQRAEMIGAHPEPCLLFPQNFKEFFPPRTWHIFVLLIPRLTESIQALDPLAKLLQTTFPLNLIWTSINNNLLGWGRQA